MKQTIFLVAGCPSTDVHAAQFMNKLKTLNPQKQYRFVGIGGPEMKKEGFESIGVNSDRFLYKPFMPWKNFKWILIEAYTHPVHAYTHYKNWRVFRSLRPKYEEIVRLNASAFITFENQFFMKFFYKALRQCADDLGVIHPPTFYSGLTHINENHHHQRWLDHFFNRLPLTPQNFSKFEFPQTQVGWDGLFRAYHFLFSRNSNYSALTAQTDKLYLPAEQHNFPLHHLISELVLKERNEYRDTVLFFATGNTQHEIQWSIKRVKDAVETFLKFDGTKNLPTQSFTLVISIPPQEDLKAIAQQSLQKYKWPIRIIQVTDEQSKFGAMSASDIGLAVNGQIVAECAGLQLPTIVLDPEPFLKSYYRSLWNSFCLDLNISANGEVYPELLGSSIPMKIALTIQELHQDSKLRYYYIDRYRKILRASLCPTSAPSTPAQQNAFPDTELVGYQSGVSAMAQTVATAADKYDQIEKNIPQFQKPGSRIQLIKELGWAKGL